MSDDREFQVHLGLTVTGDDEAETREWARELARDLFGMERVVGISIRVTDLDEIEVSDE